MPPTNSRTTRSSSILAQPVQRKLTDALFKSTATKRRDDLRPGKKRFQKEVNVLSPSKKARTGEDWNPEFEDIEIDNKHKALKTPSTSALTGAELQRRIIDDDEKQEDYDDIISDEEDGRVPREQETGEEFDLNLSTVPHDNKKVIEIHQEQLTPADKLLRAFDLNYTYGPCMGFSRLERWERAKTLGLDPPEHIRILLMSKSELGQNVFHGRV